MQQPPASFPIDGLLDLACRDGVDIRPTLLRVLTDLYVQKRLHTPEEDAQYAELACRLIDTVDPATRATVVSRLADYGTAPAEIMRHIEGLAAAPALPAKADQPARHDLVELFFAATPDERRLILTNLEVAAGREPRRAPTSTEIIRRLETAALQRNTGEFSRMLQRALNIGGTLAGRIARDHFGEPIVIAAKVLGMKSEILQRILLFLNPAVGQSVQRVYDLVRLYDEINLSAAERMVAIWQKSSGIAKPAHEPLYWHVEPRQARAGIAGGRTRAAEIREDFPLAASGGSR